MAGDRCPRPLYPCCAAGGDERRFVKGGSIPERSPVADLVRPVASAGTRVL
jgi:hypothetical protein